MATQYELTGVFAKDDGTNLGFTGILNFVGAGVTAALQPDGSLTVTIPGGGGGGGTPSLPFTSVQFNNAGSFGGSQNFTWSGTDLVVSNGGLLSASLGAALLKFSTNNSGTLSVKNGAADAPLNLDILDLQINSASGLLGQVLTSAGPGASPTWSAIPAAAPANGAYLVAVLSGGLSDERLFTSTTLNIADGGAGGNFIVDLPVTGVVAASYTNTSLTVDVNGRITAASNGPAIAPGTAQYLTLALDAGLPNERRFVPAARLAGTDGGAGGNYTLDLATAGTAGVYAYPASVTTDAYGRVTAVTAGTAPLVPSLVTTSAVNYVMAASTTIVLANPGNPQTIQLPAANAVGVVIGRDYTVKRINTSVNVVTVTSAGGTIDGVAAATGISLAAGSYDSITVVSDGTNWWIT